MSGITATSLKADVLSYYNTFQATTAQQTNWVALANLASKPTGTKVGLFGADLTAFLADCAVAQGAASPCVVADYASFNGWAFGIQWTNGSAATT